MQILQSARIPLRRVHLQHALGRYPRLVLGSPGANEGRSDRRRPQRFRPALATTVGPSHTARTKRHHRNPLKFKHRPHLLNAFATCSDSSTSPPCSSGLSAAWWISGADPVPDTAQYPRIACRTPPRHDLLPSAEGAKLPVAAQPKRAPAPGARPRQKPPRGTRPGIADCPWPIWRNLDERSGFLPGGTNFPGIRSCQRLAARRSSPGRTPEDPSPAHAYKPAPMARKRASERLDLTAVVGAQPRQLSEAGLKPG